MDAFESGQTAIVIASSVPRLREITRSVGEYVGFHGYDGGSGAAVAAYLRS